MFYAYFLSASALAAVSLGAALYTVTGHGEPTVEGAQPSTSADGGPEHLVARYREQMKLTQETLRSLGYISGPIEGFMGAGTATALRAFQQRQGLRTTGRADPGDPRRAQDRRQAEARAVAPPPDIRERGSATPRGLPARCVGGDLFAELEPARVPLRVDRP